eukprot:c29397_g2_i2 orf=1-981(-)
MYTILSKVAKSTCFRESQNKPPNNIVSDKGGYLTKAQQKKWMYHIKLYHSCHKSIATFYLCRKYYPTSPHKWISPSIIDKLKDFHETSQLSTPSPIEVNIWIDSLAKIAKTAKRNAASILQAQQKHIYNKFCHQWRKKLLQKPQTMHRKIFQSMDTVTLNALQSKNNLLTHPHDISNEIYETQCNSFSPKAPTCQTTHHPNNCSCQDYKYPWHDFDGFVLEKRGNPLDSINTYFSRSIFDECLHSLSHDKTPGPDNLPNELLQSLGKDFLDTLYQLFQVCYSIKKIPPSWKNSTTILLYKKGDPHTLGSYRPISLANTTYKLFTSTL